MMFVVCLDQVFGLKVDMPDFGFDNIVADTISGLPSTPSNKTKPCTRKAQCRANKLFAIFREENYANCFPLSLLIVKI